MENGSPKLFLLLTMDALRADRLGYAGYDRPTTPRMDELSEESLVFENAFACGPWTPVAVPAMTSSTLPLNPVASRPWLVEERPYLPRVLAQRGVATGVAHCHPVLNESFGYDGGVDAYVDIKPPGTEKFRRRCANQFRMRSRAQAAHDRLARLPLWKFWKPLALGVYRTVARLVNRLYYYSWDVPAHALAEDVTDTAIRSLDSLREGDRPVFMWIHYLEPHGPYFPPEEFRDIGRVTVTEEVRRRINRNFEKWMMERDPDLDELPLDELTSLYDAEIRHADREIGRLLDWVRKRGLWDSTAVAITSDHGEEFGEHGGLFHSFKLHRELLQVPLLLRTPGRPPRRIAQTVSMIDLCPTVADFFGVEADPEWEGRSLLRYADGEPQPDENPPAVSEGLAQGEPHIAATGENLRLIYSAGEWSAYRTEDRLEQRDVYDSLRGDAELAELKAFIERRLQQVAGEDEQRQDFEADDDLKDRLKALGYYE
jgi:arylsulfatase A-like enzyme